MLRKGLSLPLAAVVAVLFMAGCAADRGSAGAEGGERWTVAVLDGGLDHSLPLRARSVARLDALPESSPTAGDPHAGKVASVALGLVAGDDHLPRAAPDLLDVRVSAPSSPPTPDSIAIGIDLAVGEGADLILVAMSTGSDSEVLRDAIERASARDAVVVSSLRNELIGAVSFPADYESVLAVSSIGADGQRSATSPRDGDLSALGEDVIAPGSSELAPASGTSVAAASAAADILRCSSPADSRAQILSLAERSGLKDDRNVPVLRCAERNKQ